MPLTIALSASGHLIADESAENAAGFPEDLEPAARAALSGGDGAVLLWLLKFKNRSELPMTAQFWREFAGDFMTALCRGNAPDPTRHALRIEQAPPMRGLEYLSSAVLNELWKRLGSTIQECVVDTGGALAEWIKLTLPHWHLVGRVTFHLAENKKDTERPFAFLATYTSGLTPEGKPRHLPLGQAIKEYASNREALLRLLEPISLAAERSNWVREMADSGAVYRPQGWSPSEALKFLREVPTLENAGIAVRIPNWWKPGAPPRPQVSITVGDDKPAAFSAGQLLSFTVEIALDGEKLTQEELDAIQTAEGLVLVKGKWVEADPEKLRQVMEHWRALQGGHFGNGIAFLQAMRLLAGSPIGAQEQSMLPEEVREWTGVNAGDWLTEQLRELRDPERLSEFQSHPKLHARLRPYQEVGANWLHYLTRLGLGACLADDMGLGKTIQILALLLQISDRDAPPSLLVAPASLLANWKAEAERFAPSLKVWVAHPSGDDPEIFESWAAGKKKLPKCDLVITTYGLINRLERFAALEWRLLILDEAQAIKNPSAAQTRAIKTLRGQSRIALTGTPIENRLADLWSIFDFLNPGLLGSAPAFAQFIKKLTRNSGANYAPLRGLVRPYILRRLKTDRSIIDDLPDKTEVTAWCLLTRPQAVLYQKAVDQLAAALRDSEGIQRRGLILAALTTFKQICNHPAQHSGNSHYDPEESGKFRRLRELCRPIAERQERLLLFTQFTEIIPALQNYLRELFGRDGLKLTGETPVKKRRALVEEFQSENGPPFFILSLKAGGSGLTLTAASHVIHFDRWWNPAVENQATDRAFRIGQKRNVMVHKFVCRGTLEEKIDRTLAAKKTLSDSLLANDQDEFALTELSDQELLELVTLDLNRISAD